MRLRHFRTVHAPDFPGLKTFRGQPILLFFWTSSDRNSLHAAQLIESLYKKYALMKLAVIGIHSPEFSFEHEQSSINRIIADLDITFPIIADNDFKLWDAYNAKHWPQVFFIDHLGVIVHHNLEESMIEHAIQGAFRSMGQKSLPKLAGIDDHKNDYHHATPNCYLGYLHGVVRNALDVLPETEEAITDIGNHEENVPYLHGHWRISAEKLEHTRTLSVATEYVAIKYSAFQVDAVLGALDNREIIIDVTIDGKPIPASMTGQDIVIDNTGNTHLHITHHRLYSLVNSSHFHTASLKLAVKNAGVCFYHLSFTGRR